MAAGGSHSVESRFVHRFVAMALFAVVLIGCGGSVEATAGSSAKPPTAHREPPAPLKAKFFSLDQTPVVTLRPPTPTNRLVLYLHGSAESSSALVEEEVRPLTTALLARGFAVAASTGGQDSNWGNRASVKDSVDLVHHLGYKHVYILAQSMGGIGGVELIDKLRPVAWAGIFPVCNARSVWALGGEAGDIEAIWGPGPPPAKISPVEAKDVKGMPALMFASPEDTHVPVGPNADACASWMNRRGADAKVIETVGEHGDPSNFQPKRLANFFSRASRRLGGRPSS